MPLSIATSAKKAQDAITIYSKSAVRNNQDPHTSSAETLPSSDFAGSFMKKELDSIVPQITAMPAGVDKAVIAQIQQDLNDITSKQYAEIAKGTAFNQQQWDAKMGAVTKSLEGLKSATPSAAPNLDELIKAANKIKNETIAMDMEVLANSANRQLEQMKQSRMLQLAQGVYGKEFDSRLPHRLSDYDQQNPLDIKLGGSVKGGKYPIGEPGYYRADNSPYTMHFKEDGSVTATFDPKPWYQPIAVLKFNNSPSENLSAMWKAMAGYKFTESFKMRFEAIAFRDIINRDVKPITFDYPGVSLQDFNADSNYIKNMKTAIKVAQSVLDAAKVGNGIAADMIFGKEAIQLLQASKSTESDKILADLHKFRVNFAEYKALQDQKLSDLGVKPISPAAANETPTGGTQATLPAADDLVGDRVDGGIEETTVLDDRYESDEESLISSREEAEERNEDEVSVSSESRNNNEEEKENEKEVSLDDVNPDVDEEADVEIGSAPPRPSGPGHR